MFELIAGRIFSRPRPELSFLHGNNDTNQMFRGITYYDGTPIEERSGGTVVSNARALIDDLTLGALSLNG